MYTITRGPSKLATQRRTGPTQQVENKAAEGRGAWPPCSPTPKLVFNRVNGKRSPATTQPPASAEESYTLAHEENVRFVYEAWQQVERQLEGSRPGESGRGPVQYTEKVPSPALTNFVPIDLEEWWAQQFLAEIENGS
ncbi:MAPK regulated corepressor interacting protein 2 isoform X2 [Carettochelys insculpta]|uniref:MAPK regulated corepressor interacting protein 2 isoform X2 n=1 Tax=Carettochelys insculpta TaxID=44489 RepID=UPI003EC085D3